MTGIAKGLLPEYARRSMITERDRNQLYQLFDILAKADTEPEQLGRLVEVNDEIANDPESSEIALAVSAVALDGITQSEDSSVVAKTAEVVGADVVGTLAGFNLWRSRSLYCWGQCLAGDSRRRDQLAHVASITTGKRSNSSSANVCAFNGSAQSLVKITASLGPNFLAAAIA